VQQKYSGFEKIPFRYFLECNINKLYTESGSRKVQLLPLREKFGMRFAGANDYLAKPFETEKLLSMLRVWLY
jgi:hypothetical protein